MNVVYFFMFQLIQSYWNILVWELKSFHTGTQALWTSSKILMTNEVCIYLFPFSSIDQNMRHQYFLSRWWFNSLVEVGNFPIPHFGFHHYSKMVTDRVKIKHTIRKFIFDTPHTFAHTNYSSSKFGKKFTSSINWGHRFCYFLYLCNIWKHSLSLMKSSVLM